MKIALCANPECGVRFELQRGPGRPRKYCSDQCRVHMLRTVFQPAWYKRHIRKQIRSLW